jgi:hypothetical protein
VSVADEASQSPQKADFGAGGVFFGRESEIQPTKLPKTRVKL